MTNAVLTYKTVNLHVKKIWGLEFYNTVIKNEYKNIYFKCEEVLHPTKLPITNRDKRWIVIMGIFYILAMISGSITATIISSICFFGIQIMDMMYRKNAFKYKQVRVIIISLLYIILLITSLVPYEIAAFK